MKKIAFMVCLLMSAMLLSACEDGAVGSSTSKTASCEHDYLSESYTPATCSSKGEKVFKCRKCGDQYTEELEISPSSHKAQDITVLKAPTLTEHGTGQSVCELCGTTYERYIYEIGEQISNPYIIDSASLWKSVRKNGSADYAQKYLQVTGKIKRVSVYSDMCGYYLEGNENGSGVICWKNERSQSLQKGQTVTFLGYVSVDNGTESIELTRCEVIK